VAAVLTDSFLGPHRRPGEQIGQTGVVKELEPARRQFIRIKGEAIYRDEATGKTWTGMGRMPGWLKQKVQNGEPIERKR